MDWTEEDDALVTHESLPDWHPSLFVDVFHTGQNGEQMSKGARCTSTYAQAASI